MRRAGSTGSWFQATGGDGESKSFAEDCAEYRLLGFGSLGDDNEPGGVVFVRATEDERFVGDRLRALIHHFAFAQEFSLGTRLPEVGHLQFTLGADAHFAGLVQGDAEIGATTFKVILPLERLAQRL